LFYRDVVHAYEYGEQILSQILMSFWTASKGADAEGAPYHETIKLHLRIIILPEASPGRMGLPFCLRSNIRKLLFDCLGSLMLVIVEWG
jgi:hypothetical protein